MDRNVARNHHHRVRIIRSPHDASAMPCVSPLSTCTNGDRLVALGCNHVGGSTSPSDNPRQFSPLALPPSHRWRSFSSRISAKLPSANKDASMIWSHPVLHNIIPSHVQPYVSSSPLRLRLSGQPSLLFSSTSQTLFCRPSCSRRWRNTWVVHGQPIIFETGRRKAAKCEIA